ncbi:MAG: hypothetical protein RIS94_2997, partial [Pseudomonadota bacterium]
MIASPLGWAGFGQWMFLLAAFAAMLLAVWLWDRRRRGKAASRMEMTALALAALWSMMEAGAGPVTFVAQFAEVLRNLGWLAVVYALFARDNRHATVAPVRPVLVVLALVELLQVVLLLLNLRVGGIPAAAAMIFQISVMFRLLLATGALVLVHNLYAGAMTVQRGVVRWTCLALALMWGYDLNFYTIAYLGGGVPQE